MPLTTAFCVATLIAAGIRLLLLYAKTGFTYALGADISPDIERRARLMSALDSVNMRYGRRTLTPACAGIQQGWSMKRQKLSPRYTTVFDELMLASAR